MDLTGFLLKSAFPECSLKMVFLLQVHRVRGSAPFTGRFHLCCYFLGAAAAVRELTRVCRRTSAADGSAPPRGMPSVHRGGPPWSAAGRRAFADTRRWPTA